MIWQTALMVIVGMLLRFTLVLCAVGALGLSVLPAISALTRALAVPGARASSWRIPTATKQSASIQ